MLHLTRFRDSSDLLAVRRAPGSRRGRRWLQATGARAALIGLGLLAAACHAAPPGVPPAIEFSDVPHASDGGSEVLGRIAGRVVGARPGQRIVLFAKAGVWWVQPFEQQPFTPPQADGTWHSPTHLGTHYAALLVEPGYQPPPTTAMLPQAGGPVVAVAMVEGKGPLPHPPEKQLQFSGYKWDVRQAPSNRGGDNLYDAANAFTDDHGFLHLRIARRGTDWSCAEVSLTRSLGYGTYAFVVRETGDLDAAATFSMFTWDDLGADQNHRGIDVEIGRWGVPANKNAQYLIQPYYVPANVSRFAAPAGRLTHAFRWQPGRVAFSTVRTALAGRAAQTIAGHDFASGVPAAGGELVRINLYVFRSAPIRMQHEVEVVIEKFEYLP
jgi:hypothetical protein